MRLLIRILGVLLFILIIVSLIHHPAEQPTTKLPLPSVCSRDAPPCIQMVTPDHTYQFNDFRFMPNGCITFDALPGHVAGSYCGLVKLMWIGPVAGTRSE